MSRQRSVWGYFALSIVSLGLGVFLLILSAGSAIPVETKLEKMTGYVNKVIVVGDLTDTVTAMTAFNAIHFTLVDMDTVFRYPNRWPGYNDLYNRLAFEVDVWVDPEALDRGEPVVIYRLEQSVPTG